MKCPKCGYTSFDYLDECKKCGKDLVEFKQRFAIRSVLFPGQLSPADGAAAAEYDATADAAMAAATATAATATASQAAAANESDPALDVASAEAGTESDDFGFDFMGDSTEEDDLSFDELFEEAPEEEDVEETIEGPKSAAEEDSGDKAEFSFEDSQEDELEDDFGFDPDSVEKDEVLDFFDEDDRLDQPEQGTEEDPKSPFDLPESSVVGGAPETSELTAEDLPAALASELEAGVDVVENAQPAVQEELGLDSLAPVKSTADESVPAAFIDDAAEPARQIEPLPEDRAAIDGLAEAAQQNEPSLEEPAADGDAGVVPVAEAAVSDASAPTSVAALFAVPTVGRRLIAIFCDLLILGLLGTSFIVAAEGAMATGPRRWLPSPTTLIDLSIPYFLVLFFLAFSYFTLFHFLAGQTPGKMFVRLRVESVEGEALTFSEAFLRSVGGLLQLLPMGLGHLSMLLYDDRRGWNDRLAATRVVNL